MKKHRMILGLIIICFVVTIIPLIVDWLIIGNNVPSNISNSGWVTFLGAYIGALVSGAISLSGIVLTIRFTREQNKMDRELQIRPYFDIVQTTPIIEENWLGEIKIAFDGEPSIEVSKIGSSGMRLKNVGTGPATDIFFLVSLDHVDIRHKAEYDNTCSYISTNLLREDECGTVPIIITHRISHLSGNDVIDHEDRSVSLENNIEVKNKKIHNIPEDFYITLKLMYRDLIGNQFCQVICLSAVGKISFVEFNEYEFNFEIEIVEMLPPIKDEE